MSLFKYHIFICLNERTPDDPRGSCTARGSREIHEAFKNEVKKHSLKATVRANKAGCLDQCANGPTVVIYPEGTWYHVANLDDVSEIMTRHILGGTIVERLEIKTTHDEDKLFKLE